ncbi:hypothetical protein AW736_03455 [Termitidicoccus mucosus]|uniref:Autotransporter domain-containing protein n=1 Tax=Termitidicoccus mucosus TaxID=1184151 RepID=A0A178INK6_9BACT|nr:hypothetical protein AW736_03455 [Opitutaceae bacterium TSB47]
MVQASQSVNLTGGALNGSGTLALDRAGETGAFFTAAQASGSFTGVVRLQNSSTLSLSQLAAATQSVLAGSPLQLASGGRVLIDDSTRTLDHLDLAGGSLIVATNTAAGLPTPHVLATGTLSASGAGSEVWVADTLLAGLATAPATLNSHVFDADADTQAAIVRTSSLGAGLVAGTGLTVKNMRGRALTTATSAIEDAAGAKTGALHYGYTAVVTATGISLGWGVSAIESTTQLVDGLGVEITSAGSVDKTLGAQLTGTGGFTFTGGETMTLAHTGNDYQGATLITGSATVKAGVDNALGQTSALAIREGSAFDLNSRNQRVGALAIDDGGLLALGDRGDFTVSGVALFSGSNVLTGGTDSKLRLANSGSAAIRVSNTGFTGDVYLGDAASSYDLYLGNLSGLGDAGRVWLDGGSLLYLETGGTFAKALAGGAGTVLVGGDQDVLLTGNNSGFAGEGAEFEIGQNATLRAQNAAALGSALVGGTAGSTLSLERFSGTLGNRMTGQLALRVTGTSAVTLDRASSGFAGAIRIDAGSSLTLAAADAAGTAAVANGGLLEFAAAGALAGGAPAITNSGSLVISHSGTFAHAIANTGGVVELRTSGALEFGTALAAGTLVKTGAGVATLAAAQTHDGLTDIRAGTLAVSAANQLSARSEHRVAAGAVLSLGGFDQKVGHLRNDGLVNFVALGKTLTVASLSGTGAYAMDVNLATKETDRLVITGSATGSHTLQLTPIGGAPVNGDSFSLELVSIGSGDATFTAAPVDYGMDSYALQQGTADDPLTPSIQNWYFGRTAQSRAADAILLTAGVLSTDWHYSLDSLRLRMGELRGASAGAVPGNVWVRASAYHLSAGGSQLGAAFEQDTYAVTAGGDRSFALESGRLLVGGFIAMGRSERDHDHRGESSAGSIGAGVYATWLHHAGWYADLIARADRYDNELTARSDDGQVTRADYGSQAQGLSLEWGRRLRARGAFWFEPSAQAAVAWLNGESYETVNPLHRMTVRIGGGAGGQYRLQLRAGADLGAWQPYMKMGEVKSDTRGGVVHADGREFDPNFDGWRFETGAGVSYLIDPQS